LDHFLDWASQAGFAAAVAKAVPAFRPVMLFMGGQPVDVYRARGFEVVASWVDPELHAVVKDKHLVPDGVTSEDAARVSCCVRRLR
jgi:hypothetical protein